MTLQAIQSEPGAAAHYRAGEALHRQGDLAGALAEYDAALSLDPAHGPALCLSAMVFYQTGDPWAALTRIERAIQNSPGSADVWGAYGIILAALDRPADAAIAQRRGLALAPEDGVLWFNLGLAERGLGHTDAAIEAFAAAATRLGAAIAYHEWGASLQQAERPAEALVCYRQALTLGAGAETALNAGAACHETGDLAGAADFYRRALEQDPACAKALNNLAVVAQDAGEDAEAAELCRRAIALNPGFADAYNNLGVSLSRSGDVDGALAAYRGALEIDPFNPKARINRADLLFEHGRGEEAAQDGRALTTSHPDDPRAWLELGRVLERADDLNGAAAALEQALALDRSLWLPHHRLGEVRQRLSEPAAALAPHRRACELAPEQPDAWRQLALAAIKAGDGATALGALEPLLKLDPYDPQAWAGRALALRLAGDIAAADDLTAREDLVAVLPLPAPDGYASLAAFHRALNADLAAVRLRAWSPRGQSVVGGFQTQNDLFAETAPAIRALRQHLDQAVAAFLSDPGPSVRAFIPEAPRNRRYRAWSVNLRAGGHHAPHIHPEGRLSGVYYVDIPSGADSNDVGGLEFGRPGFAVPLSAPPPTRVVRPRAGNLVLFPSYLWHGTQTFETPGERVTVAFDLLR